MNSNLEKLNPICISLKLSTVDKVVGAVGEPGINFIAQKYSQE